jgi:hypothetical protein
LDTGAPVGVATLAEVQTRLAHCFLLAEQGAFPASPGGLLQPTSEAVALGMAADANALHSVGEFLLNNVDYRVCHVASNLVAHAIEPCRSVCFIDRTDERSVEARSWRFLAARDNADVSPYPPANESLSFRCVSEDAADMAKGRRCLITVAEPLNAASLSQLMGTVDGWVRLLEMGGYSSISTDSAVELSTLQPYDDWSVELVFSIFGAAEASWFSLFNLLASSTSATCQVTEVCVE